MLKPTNREGYSSWSHSNFCAPQAGLLADIISIPTLSLSRMIL